MYPWFIFYPSIDADTHSSLNLSICLWFIHQSSISTSLHHFTHPSIHLSFHPSIIYLIIYHSSLHLDYIRWNFISPKFGNDTHLSIHLSIIHPSIYLFIHPSSIYPSSIAPSIYLFIHPLPIHQSIALSIHLFIHSHTYPSIRQQTPAWHEATWVSEGGGVFPKPREEELSVPFTVHITRGVFAPMFPF